MAKRVSYGCLLGMLIALYLKVYMTNRFSLLVGAGWDGIGNDGYSLYMTVNWLILYLPVWMVALWHCELEWKRAYIVVYRYQCLSKWWWHTCIEMFLTLILSYLCMGMTLLILEEGDWPIRMTDAFVMITIHAVGLTAVALWIRLLTGNMLIAAGSVMILEAIAKLLAVLNLFKPAYNFFLWGMVVYSGPFFGSGGYRISIAVMIQLLLAASVMFWSNSRMKIVLLRRVNDAKND